MKKHYPEFIIDEEFVEIYDVDLNEDINNNSNEDINEYINEFYVEDIKDNQNDLQNDNISLVELGQIQKKKLKPVISKLTINKDYLNEIINNTLEHEPNLLSNYINYIPTEDKIVLVINSNIIPKQNLNENEVKDLKELRKLYRNYDYNATYLKNYLEESHIQLNDYQINHLNKLEDRNISPQQGKYYSSRFTHNNYSYTGTIDDMEKYTHEDLEFILSCPDFMNKPYIVNIDGYIGILISELIRLEYNDILSLTLSDIIINYNYYENLIDTNEKYNINKLFGSKK